jgi:hypothetical protein
MDFTTAPRRTELSALLRTMLIPYSRGWSSTPCPFSLSSSAEVSLSEEEEEEDFAEVSLGLIQKCFEDD